MRAGIGVLAVLVLAAVAVHALWPRPELAPAPPRTEVEAVVRAHADLVDALIEGKHAELWALLSARGRALLADNLRWWRGSPSREPGLTREELESADPERFLALALERFAQEHPDLAEQETRFLRTAPIGRVDMDEDAATVVYRVDPEEFPRLEPFTEMRFRYELEDGAWRLAHMEAPPMSLRTLERKVSVVLPRSDGDDPPEVDAAVTIGAEGIAEEGARLLTGRIRALFGDDAGDAVVVLDAHPSVSWTSVVRAQDAIRRAGVERVLFAAATEAGPGPGVRVNGVRLGERPGREEPPERELRERIVRIRRHGND